MSAWFKRLIADKDGNPNEHIIAALWGSFALLALTLYLCHAEHAPSLIEFGGAHGAIWSSAGLGQKLSGGS